LRQRVFDLLVEGADSSLIQLYRSLQSFHGLFTSHWFRDPCSPVMDPPAYILSLQNNIRARPISWEGAVRAKTITESDLKRIKAIDKVRKEQRKQTVESSPEDYVTLLLGNNESPSIFQAAQKRTDIVQYMLVLTGDLIDGIADSVACPSIETGY